MPLTSEAKKLLAETIRGSPQNPERGLRARLIRAVHDEAHRRYRLAVPIASAGLDEAHRRQRERLDAWLDERARSDVQHEDEAAVREARDRVLTRAEADVAATLLHRLVVLRHLEALGLSKPAVVTGGWESRGYREFRGLAPGLTGDETEGYRALLDLVFDEQAADFPDLFGRVEIASLLPIPASALRDAVDALDDPNLAPAWTDDTTLGWVYQYWNDPERRRIDARLDAQAKLERSDVAAKTQVFTDRYMVEWLLQNSLGAAWLAICQKQGWTADAERNAPPYFIPRPVAPEAVRLAPDSVRQLKILDPACGSGHFLVIAFGMLAALYREEARHRGQIANDCEIAESIVEQNLFGIDIDPRACQIAAAALGLKARAVAKDARPRAIHVVAPPPGPAGSLGSLFKSDDLARAGAWDLVVGNPPYFGTQALADTEYIDRVYPRSKENLCTAFLERAMELAAPGGQVAFVTVRSWLYVSQSSALRTHVLQSFAPSCAADLGLGGFDSLPGVEAMMVVLRRGAGDAGGDCLVVDAREGDSIQKEALLSRAEVTHRTEPAQLAKLPGSPFVYRWSKDRVADYLAHPLLGDVAPVRVGMKTSDNARFLRRPWEIAAQDARRAIDLGEAADYRPYVKGAAGKAWIEPLADVVRWRDAGIEVRLALQASYAQGPQGEAHFFKRGVAFSTIGRSFVARAHRYRGLFDVAGSSVFPADEADVPAVVCLLNSRYARDIVEDLNPTVNFQVGDVARVPYRPDARATAVFRILEDALGDHESADERHVAFKAPGPSSWESAQAWAQSVVDSPEAAGLPAYVPVVVPASPFAWISYAVGVALGRMGQNGDGWADTPPEGALPSGLLFVSAAAVSDSLDHPACARLIEIWREHGPSVSGASEALDLRTYLRTVFFEEHRRHYGGRPIYFPLSSRSKSFVALASIHRWQKDTLSDLLADHLMPEKRRLDGEREDLEAARARAGGGMDRASKRFFELKALLEELNDFIAKVTETAERGPTRSSEGVPEREVDARYEMNLDDGVMVSSAALWPLLEPQWKEPKKWWENLASRTGPKGANYDWSAAAVRHFPTRVTKECEESPVLAAAHRCLWRHHPRTAYEWELRLQQGRPDFTITEPDAAACRHRFLKEQPVAALEVRDAEATRALRATRKRVRARENESAGSAITGNRVRRRQGRRTRPRHPISSRPRPRSTRR